MSDERSILQRLRAVMARELETINEYERFADATEDPEIKALFQHLADEEKEHVTEVYEVLKTRDAAQAAWEQGAHVQAIRAGTFGEAITAGVPKHGSDDEPHESPVDDEPQVPPAQEAPAPAVSQDHEAPAPVTYLPAAPPPSPIPVTRPRPALTTVGSLFGLPQD
jgi:hypothetical protein